MTVSLLVHSTAHNSSNSVDDSSVVSASSRHNGTTDSVQIQIENVCPGSMELLANGAVAQEIVMPWDAKECSVPVPDWRAKHGVIFGKCSKSRNFCHFFVQVPQAIHVNIHVRIKSSECGRGTTIYDGWPSRDTGKYKLVPCYRNIVPGTVYLSSTNQIYISHYNSPSVQIWFEAVEVFHTVHTSEHSGYVTFSAYDRYWINPSATLRTQLKAPSGTVFVVSFKVSREYYRCVWVSDECLPATCIFKSVALSWKEHNSNQTSVFTYVEGTRTFQDWPVKVCRTANLEVQLQLREGRQYKNCLKMLFSIHPKMEIPYLLSSGLFNCSVDYYWRFKQHLDCNRKIECLDGRDETEHCSFRNRFCKDEWVKSHNKCFKLVSFSHNIAVAQAREECKNRGMKQGAVKTEKELKDFLALYQGRVDHHVFIGLSSGWTSVPFMYSKFYKWSDYTMIYDLNRMSKHIEFHISKSVQDYVFRNTEHYRFGLISVAGSSIFNVLCEKDVPVEEILLSQSVTFPFVSTPSPHITNTQQVLTLCPQGHMTHEFLQCDPKAQCAQVLYLSVCIFLNRTKAVTDATPKLSPTYSIPNYACSVGIVKISYTLVCDFMYDCPDQSDELFCKHPICSTFTCKNGQCLSTDKLCNEQSDCLDDSDEAKCFPSKRIYTDEQVFNQSLFINLDGKGYFTRRLMNDSETCPTTHYLCTAEKFLCLPVYTRCNRIYDCIYHEDERDCDKLVCPGFYRCRGSTVCVHVDHLCDGWPQCVQRDDEWLCDTICPEGCLCQGQAFLCRQSFSAHLYHHLRYLDAKGSEMALLDLRNNSYLVHLNLAYCSIRFLPGILLPNLRTLDLSFNLIVNLSLNAVYELQNLQILVLKGNPLILLDTGLTRQRHTALKSLDLSETDIDILDSQILLGFSQLEHLDVSFAQLHSIARHGLQLLPRMQELDIRGNFISKFPDDLFFGLSELTLVHASDYRLCCHHLLPVRVPATQCLAPQHFMSSCQNMLQVEAHRHYLWVIGAIASLGNALCVVFHCTGRWNVFTRTFTMFMTNLQCANLGTGFYAVAIAAADEVFRGQYHRHEYEWTKSAACKVAGFLSLLSSTVTVFTLWLLTVDHIAAFYTSLAICKFSKKSVVLACALTWIVGSLLASFPLLPGLEQWGQYGHTAICSLMLSGETHSLHAFRFVHSTLILYVLLYAMVTGGIAIIYRATPKYLVLTGPDKKPIYTSSQLLVKIALTDAVSWFLVAPIKLMAMEIAKGSNKINVTMAVFILPLNSALNPMLCLWHAVVYGRQQKQDELLLKRLKAQLKC